MEWPAELIGPASHHCMEPWGNTHPICKVPPTGPFRVLEEIRDK